MTQGSSRELAQWIAHNLDRKGGIDIRILEIEELSSVAAYLIIATGTSKRHMETLLQSPCNELKKLGYPPRSIEGEGTNWLLADLDDIVLHVFDETTRQYYDLEGLWQKAPRIPWNDQAAITHSPS